MWNGCVVPCPILTIASWPAYRFLRSQVRWSGLLISLRIFQFVVIHTVKGFGIVNKAEVGVFSWDSLALSMIQRMLAIWSLVYLCFLNPAWISGSSRFTYFWSLAWRILSITLLVCAVLSHFSHVRLFVTLWTIACQAFLSMGFSRQEYWSGFPFPSPASVWDECNCVVVWAFFGIAFLWDWNENWPFPVLWPLLSFPNLLAYWVQHFHSIIF